MSKEPRQPMSKKTKAFITGAVFILAILVLILCIMSGAMRFTPAGTSATPTATPPVTAPPAPPTPSPSAPAETDEPEEPKEFSVTVFANHGGSADPSGTTTVKEGGSITIYFTPDPGFRVDTVTVNGELVEAADKYVIENIAGDMTIDVSFDTDVPETTPPDDPQTSEPLYNYGMP